MLDGLKRIFRQSDDAERQRFFGMIDALNAEAAGGAPTTVERQLGTLKIRSGVLALGDPRTYRPSKSQTSIPIRSPFAANCGNILLAVRPLSAFG